MSNTVSFDLQLSAEDRSLLNYLAEQARDTALVLNKCMELLNKMGASVELPKAEVTYEMPVKLEPVDEELPPEFKEEVKPEPVAEAIPTVDEIKTAAITVANHGKKAEAKAIVLEYAKSVSDIPEDKRAEALKRIKELM